MTVYIEDRSMKPRGARLTLLPWNAIVVYSRLHPTLPSLTPPARCQIPWTISRCLHVFTLLLRRRDALWKHLALNVNTMAWPELGRRPSNPKFNAPNSKSPYASLKLKQLLKLIFWFLHEQETTSDSCSWKAVRRSSSIEGTISPGWK